jgi:hypothetical protein
MTLDLVLERREFLEGERVADRWGHELQRKKKGMSFGKGSMIT